MKGFEKLGVRKDLVKGLAELSIVQPTSIQEEVIPTLLEGNKDIVAQAQTGTGKTAAFGIPLLTLADAKKPFIQGLIICPTRELVKQVAKQLFKYTKYSEKVFVESVFGGEPIEKQIVALKRPTQIVVATPGRLVDLLNQKAINLSQVKTVVLDEADEMLSMGFQKELDKIFDSLPYSKNTWLFSATLPHEVQQVVTKNLAKDAKQITVQRKDLVNKNISHHFIVCEEAEKFNALFQFLRTQGNNRGIIFCRTKAISQTLAKQIIAKNISADALHGDLLQKEREKVMRAFRNEKIRLLITTDVSARGIDVDDLSFVVHYQLPEKEEYYTHRSGRTARAGKEGVSISLVSPAEVRKIKNLEQRLRLKFHRIKEV